jgi:type IV secretion system protein TrbL
VLYLVFSLLLFIVLIVRRLGIFVISLFIPVYAGGLGGGWTNGMVKRASEILLVLLLSKLAIIGTFTLGESMLVGDSKGLDVEVNAVGGVVVMAFAVLSPLGVMYLVAFADGLLVGQIASGAHHGRSGLTTARNQIRGHDGHGNRSALGRVTGHGRDRVRRDQQGGIGGGRGVIAAARRAAQRARPGGTSGARPSGRPSDPSRQARARGARRAAGRPPTNAPTPKNRGAR